MVSHPGSSAGKTYGGRYQIQGSIASGGMAEVFIARDLLLDRLVALKILHPEYARNESFIERFRREAQAAASLNDPRIVSIFDWGSDDGTYFIVMEYVEGNTLAEIIKASGPLPISKAVKVATEVLGGLSLAHQKGIVHRDVKPANIAITVSGQIKVMDFGIARAAHDGALNMTQTGMVIGTAGYFSPEQAQGKPVDARSDIYSVGIVLYEMLTGQVPFRGDSPVAVAYKHVTEDAAPPRDLAEDIPPALEAVVMKALAKNPANRYQATSDMTSDLQRAIRGEEVEATPVLSSQEQTAMMEAAYAARPPEFGGHPERTGVLTESSLPVKRRPQAAKGIAKGLVTVALLVAIGIGVMAFLMFSETAAPDIAVPRVTGLSLEEAQRVLDEAGLRSRVARRQPSPDLPAFSVISQDPEDGRRVAANTEISLVISLGPEQVDIPNLVGMSRAEAEQLLVDVGLERGEVTLAPSDTVPEGQVISQTPASGSLEKGEFVSFVVSSGKDLTPVPEVVGALIDTARNTLSGAGMTVTVQEGCSATRDSGLVLAQDPEAGTEVAEDAEVVLTVNTLTPVPSVVAEMEVNARNTLERAGFRVITEASAFQLPMVTKVTSQSPEPGDRACPGDTVTIRF